MANFEQALKITANNEGGYSNDTNDHGGETMRGIARKYWPNWPGWKIVDEFKGQPKFISIINSSQAIKDLAATFYKQNFWDVNKLDQINDQQLANSVYDFGVNAGVGTAAKTLQRAVGITADGIIGSGTLQAVNSANAENLYNTFNSDRKSYYGTIIARDPSQKAFQHSWLSRIKPYNK